MIAILTTRNDNGKVWDWTVSSRLALLIFLNSQTCLIFIKRDRMEMRKFSNLLRLYLIFVYILYFIFFIFYFYYIKINIFHKNKNIVNFYKLFIKKYSNYYYYLY